MTLVAGVHARKLCIQLPLMRDDLRPKPAELFDELMAGTTLTLITNIYKLGYLRCVSVIGAPTRCGFLHHSLNAHLGARVN